MVAVGWKGKFFAMIAEHLADCQRRQNLSVNAMWRTLILFVRLLIAACQHKRPEFTSRVREDCAIGDKWACDLLDALAPRIASDPISPDGAQKP
jgi:hypothetical protein